MKKNLIFASVLVILLVGCTTHNGTVPQNSVQIPKQDPDVNGNNAAPTEVVWEWEPTYTCVALLVSAQYVDGYDNETDAEGWLGGGLIYFWVDPNELNRKININLSNLHQDTWWPTYNFQTAREIAVKHCGVIEEKIFKWDRAGWQWRFSPITPEIFQKWSDLLP